MKDFKIFLEEIGTNILREDLTYVSSVTGISRNTLVRCFRESISVPRLSTIRILLIFLDWKVCIKCNRTKKEVISSDIETLVRIILKSVDFYSVYKNLNVLPSIYNFVSGNCSYSLYKVFTILYKLGFTISIVKPNYQLINGCN